MEIDAGGKTPITLPDDIYGILGLRSWNVNGEGKYLHSLFADHEWTGTIQQAEKPTTLPGEHGFYAYRLSSRLSISDFYSTLFTSALFPGARIQVHGLVELRGRVIEHIDGVIRGEWCRILCFFLPVPVPSAYSDRPVSYSSPGVLSSADMKTQIRESGWLKAMLARYRVPVYLTDANKFGTICEKLLEFDRGRANQPVQVEYQETRPEIVKKVDELVEQANQIGFHIPHILLNRKQMKEFKAAISAAVAPVENPVLYKRVRISCIDYAEDRTPYLTGDYRLAG